MWKQSALQGPFYLFRWVRWQIENQTFSNCTLLEYSKYKESGRWSEQEPGHVISYHSNLGLTGSNKWLLRRHSTLNKIIGKKKKQSFLSFYIFGQPSSHSPPTCVLHRKSDNEVWTPKSHNRCRHLWQLFKHLILARTLSFQPLWSPPPHTNLHWRLPCNWRWSHCAGYSFDVCSGGIQAQPTGVKGKWFGHS